MVALVEENFKAHKDYVMRDPVLFGDYKNTVEESEPRLYEDLQDFDAAKALFQEVGRSWTAFPFLIITN